MEKTWLKSYPPGVPETLSVDTYRSIVEAFEVYVKQYAKKPAFTSFGVIVSYQDIEKMTRHFAAFLQQQLKMKKSERFAIMLPNLFQFPVALFGALRAGLTVVNVNPMYTVRELAYQLKDAGVTGIIVLENFASELAKALPKTDIKHVIVTKLGDSLGPIKERLANFVVKRVKKLVPQWDIAHAVYYKEAIKVGKTLPLEAVNIKPEDAAFLQYTGGTTGLSKGAVLTHRNIVANVAQSLAWVKTCLLNGEEVVLTALPLYHIFSLTVCCFAFMAFGSQCLLITNPRDMKGFIKTLRKTPPTIFIGLNTLFNALLQCEEFKKINFSTMKLVIAGGMAMQESVAKKWKKVTGKTVIEGYGLTEASPVVAINPLTIKHYNGSVGLPLPETDVVVRDDVGNDLPVGEAGELCVKGPQVMQGYWNNSSETALVLDNDGWLKTGDIAKIDERGFIYILDRKKDMIIISGFNVYPNEVEEVIVSHPDVREVAVVGVPNEKTGEAIKAVVVKNSEKLTEIDLLTHCRERLTGYKIPKQVEFRSQLPKSSVGKVLRRELR
jgi:long-chain acyl-CoA synthetase